MTININGSLQTFTYDDLANIPAPHKFCFLTPPKPTDQEGVYEAIFSHAYHRITHESCPVCGSRDTVPLFIIHSFLPPAPLSIDSINVKTGLIMTYVEDESELHPLRWHISCPWCGWNRATANSRLIWRYNDDRSIVKHRISPSYISPAQAIIYALLARDGPQTSTDLSRILHMSQPSLCNELMYLINKGLIVRVNRLYRVTTPDERRRILMRPRRMTYYKA